MDPGGLGPGCRVVEIGPGTGLVTRHLMEAGGRVTAVEANGQMASYLRMNVAAPGLDAAQLRALYATSAIVLRRPPAEQASVLDELGTWSPTGSVARLSGPS